MIIPVLIFSAAASAQCTGIFAIDMPPGEGIPSYETLASVVELREAPTLDAELAGRISVTPGTRFELETALYRTISPTVIELQQALQITGRTYGCINTLSREDYYSNRHPSVDMELAEGATFEYLQYRAEGSCFIRAEGSVIATDTCPPTKPEIFGIYDEPDTRLWIQTTLQDLSGWVLIDGIRARELCREPYNC